MSGRERRALVLILVVAGALMTSIVVLLVQQGRVMRRMETNTAAVSGMVTNTREMIGLLNDTVSGTQAVPKMEAEARPFFRSGRRDLRTTAKGLPKLDRSLASLNATAQPAFAELSSGALGSLPGMAGDIKALTVMPGLLDRRLRSLDTLASVDHRLRTVSERLGGLSDMPASLRGVKASLGELPKLGASLDEVVSVLRQMDTRLVSINEHVASLDRKTEVLRHP